MSDGGIEVPGHVLEYLSGQKTMTLATASPGGVPHATTFLYVNDGPMLFFWSKPNTTTARHIDQNPLVSFAVDEYSDDLRETKGVQGTGECDVILSGEEVARVADLFGQKFPALSPGNTLNISFFRVAPTELQFIDNSQSGGDAPEGKFGADFNKERSYSVLTDLPSLGAETMAVTLDRVEAQAGEVLVHEGGPADKFFVVVEGEVELVREKDGESETIETLGPGHFFGEVAILRDTPRSATVRTTKPTTLLSMDHESFRTLIAQALGTTEDFDQVIQERLERLGA
jgi:uncharacterized protein YhbP (UPF0306 family)